MPLRLLPLLLAVLVAAPGCDSTDAIVLDADYYVGTWDIVAITDGSGDRSAEVLSLLDEFAVDFTAARAFRLDADFTDLLNTLGQPDLVLEGTYQAQPDTRTLVLLTGGLGPVFQASGETETQVRLTAPQAIVEQLLGTVQSLTFTGDVTITLARQ